MLDQLRELNGLLNAATEIALALPHAAFPQHGNEEEVLRHTISIRLGIIERSLARRGIFLASTDDALDLDARIQELAKEGIVSPSEERRDQDTWCGGVQDFPLLS